MAMQTYPMHGGIVMQDNKAYNGQTVMVPMPAQKLNDDIIFSTFNFQFCNPCCLGFAAFYNSVKARDSRFLGDFAAAQSYSSRARRLNIAAVIIGLLFFIFAIVILVNTMQQITSRFPN